MSPVRLYSLHSARASSAETRRRLVDVAVFMTRSAPCEADGSGGHGGYRALALGPASPIRGIRAVLQRIRPRQDLRDGGPQRLRHLLAQGELGERAGQLGIAVHGDARVPGALEDGGGDVPAAGG